MKLAWCGGDHDRCPVHIVGLASSFVLVNWCSLENAYLRYLNSTVGTRVVLNKRDSVSGAYSVDGKGTCLLKRRRSGMGRLFCFFFLGLR